MAVASTGPYANCFRQITTPAPHDSIFYTLDALPDGNQQCYALKANVEKKRVCIIVIHNILYDKL